MGISVILTSYNHEKYIKQSIESILNQTYRDFELLIYDDGSSDNSMDVISTYSDSRIRVIANAYNRGTGILEYVIKNYVKNDFVAIAHSDDFWREDKLEKQMKYLTEHEDVAAVFTHVSVVGEDGEPYTDTDGFYYTIFEQENRSRYEWLRYFFYEGNCLCHPSILIRREAYDRFELFPTALRQIPDFYMWIRLCLNSGIYILEDRLTSFRIRKSDKNTSALRKDTSIRSSIEIGLVLDLFLNIVNYEEFIKIFPEAGQFADKECFINRYTFARLCLMDEMPSYKKAYGLRLLYELLQEKETRMILEKKYRFGIQDFFVLTGKFDIYGMYPDACANCCSLYYDSGDGYSEEHKCSKEYEFWMDAQNLNLVFQHPVPENIKAVRLRIDPIEGVFVRCQIDELKINGEVKRCMPLNADFRGEDGEIFTTTDPNYEVCIDTDVIENIQISYKVQRVSMEEISQRFESERAEMHLHIDELKREVELRGHLFWRLRKWIRRYKQC